MRPTGRLALSLGALPLLLALRAPSAHADAPAVPLVRLLASPTSSRAHPLADRSGRVPLAARLPPGADARAFGLLPVAPGVGAIRLLPGDIDAFAAAHPSLTLLTGPPRRAQLDVSSTWTHAAAYRKVTGKNGAGIVVGVVDTGVDIRHPDVRNADGSTRIAWMLVSGPPAGLHPQLETQYGCSVAGGTACAIYDSADIDKLIAENNTIGSDPDGHGTHVTSIAAGNGGPLVTKNPRYIGVAPGATLVVASPEPQGSGFYDPDILNGAQFVFDRADDLGLPAVLNLSLGGDFGPHDGTSLLETGLSAMVGDDKPGKAIVVAAGNSGALYLLDGQGPLGVHTEAHVSAYGDTRVPILAPVAKNGQGFVWITFRAGDHVSVGLEGPKGQTWIGMTSPGSQTGYKGSNGATGGVVNDLPSADSQIPVASNSAVVAWTGAWADQSEFAIHLQGNGEAELWVVGGDVSPDTSLGLMFERAIREGTINVPASSPTLLAVGCTLNRLSWLPLQGHAVEITSLGADPSPVPDGTCFFSAAGPTPAGLPKPDLSAPGGFVAAAMAAAADPRINPGGLFDEPGCPTSFPCYVVDDYHAIAAGTSMSSPQVAGAVALLMQQDPTLTQARVMAVLAAGAALPIGHVPYDYQLGPGELDLDGALQALAVEQASSRTPDLARSWYTLSSDYARPDPTWPIWGTVELRRTDGTLASGLDGSKLAVAVHGGALLSPPAKVRDGLFRFAVAGPTGGDGTSMTVDMTYAGSSMGTRSLPIGNDSWQAVGTVEAVGEPCGVAAGAGSARGSARFMTAPGTGGWLLLLLGAIRARARPRAASPPMRGSPTRTTAAPRRVR